VQRLRLFPLNTVLFPGAVLNLHVFEPRYRQLVSECVQADEPFGVCMIREGDEAGDPDVMPYEVGTAARITDMRPLGGGRYYLNTVGAQRFRIERVLGREPYLLAEVSEVAEDEPSDPKALAELVAEIRDVFREYLRLVVEFSGMPFDISLPGDPLEASFLIGDALQVADSMKQRLLELTNTEERLTVELGFLRRLLPQLRALLERKRDASPGDRIEQERYYGKRFSLN
jgi:Lon protease-like protein